MRRLILAGAILLWAGGLAYAQDEPRPEQLRRMYDDALAQLKQAQDRKNELAAENERLNARLAEMQKQVDAGKLRVDEVNRESASYADKSFFLRSHYGAWREFIRRYPKIEAEWRAYLFGEGPRVMPEYFDRDWPLSTGG